MNNTNLDQPQNPMREGVPPPPGPLSRSPGCPPALLCQSSCLQDAQGEAQHCNLLLGCWECNVSQLAQESSMVCTTPPVIVTQDIRELSHSQPITIITQPASQSETSIAQIVGMAATRASQSLLFSFNYQVFVTRDNSENKTNYLVFDKTNNIIQSYEHPTLAQKPRKLIVFVRSRKKPFNSTGTSWEDEARFSKGSPLAGQCS